MKNLIWRLAIVMLIVFACSGGKKLMNKNLAYIYYSDPTIIHPDYMVYHTSDTTSMLYFKFNSREALYIKKQKDSIYSAELSLHYKLFHMEDNRKLLDSATIHLTDRKSKNQQRYLSGKIPFKAAVGHDYYLELTLNDKVRDQAVQNYHVVNKKERFNRQNFLVLDKEGKITFDNYFPKDEPLTIKCNALSRTGKIMGRFYNRDFKLPAPPFSSGDPGIFEYDADSLFEIPQQPDSSFQITMDRPGIYHLQVDTADRKGLTLFQFHGSFPIVKEVEDMFEPLRYLTTRQEYRKLEDKGHTKETIDEFWFSVAGNRERGRAIIKAYYGRIQEANQFFTSYVEGWKTDRGLTYVIYGPPNVIYKTLESENWIYGEQNNVLSVNFTFYKIENPFTENDYYLVVLLFTKAAGTEQSTVGDKGRFTNAKMNKPKDKDFIYGIRAVLEAIKAGKQIDKILLQSGLKGPLVGELRRAAKELDIPAQNVPINKLNYLTRNNHQGVIAFLSPVTFQDIEQIIPGLFEEGKTPFILALDKVTDVRNFGAICRTAECTGVHAILVSSKGVAAINADAVKSSAGALMRIPVCRTSSLLNSIHFLKDSGLQVIACTEKADRLVYEGNYTDPTVIVMGSEEKGISREILQIADQQVKIPLQGEIESLNVSVATGVVLYEAVRHKLSHG